MKPEFAHPLLLRQLSKLRLDMQGPPDLESWQRFLSKVDETYKEEDQSRYLLERSLALSSEEMRELYQNLQTYSEQLIVEKSKLERSNVELARLAKYDSLTELPNRTYFIEHLSECLHNAQALSLLFIDLDGFKFVNDSVGHAAGDLLLKEAAHRLKHSVRSSDVVARLGGDEFTVILENADPEHIPLIATKILDNLSQTYVIQHNEFYISASIGIVHAPLHSQDMATLIKLADTAMYQAKHSGKNRYYVFDKSITHNITEYANLIHGLRKGLERQEFFLHYQPRINLSSGLSYSAEALLRWKHPTRGLVPPAEFIPIAENTGMIQDLGHWVLHSACQQAQRWLQQGQPVRVAVNISVKQLQHDDFTDQVKRALKESLLPAELLELEITESAAMSNVEDNIHKLSQLKALGVYISIDDFGTSYSSLNYLKRLPVHSLKIDRSFIQDIDLRTYPDASNTSIVRSIVALGKNMDLQVVAEGVETAQQAHFLQSLGCDEAQGYFFSKPLPSCELEAYMRSAHPASELPIAGEEKETTVQGLD